jgi:hypothetical protein
MVSLERRANPKLPANLSSKEPHQTYSPSESELEWLSRTAKTLLLPLVSRSA